MSTDKKNGNSGGVIKWIKIVFPPLLLLVLFALPFDMMTAAFWGVGLVAFLVCSFLVIGRLGKKIYLKVKSKDEEYPFLEVMARPALVAIIFSLAVYTMLSARDGAEDFVKDSAYRIQARCISDKRCPGSVAEWDSPFSTSSGRFGRQFPVFYQPSRDGTDFEIRASLDIDSAFIARGGVDRELSFAAIQDGTEFPVPAKPPKQ